ncbi:MAG TPA: hypothetical protein VFI61_02440, partial [Patescibacteria group bacterium]|nr:hypothetical protein [Patescibacteria group bacterium]
MNTLPNITPETIKAYQDEVSKNSSVSTAKRKSISLNRFFDWAKGAGHISENPMAQAPGPQEPNYGSSQVIKIKKNVSGKTYAIVGVTFGLIILIFLLTFKLKFPIPFITNFAQEASIQTEQNNNLISAIPEQTPASIPAGTAVNGGWNLFAKLKLTNANGEPQVGSETLTFKLFSTEKDGVPVYTSDPKQVTTDSNGEALISLDSVPNDLFFQNNMLFLEPELGSDSASLRIPISTANTPAIDAGGNIVLTSQSPSIKAKYGNFLMEGQAVTIKTADGSDGNIEINPDGSGIAHFLFEGNKG